MAGFRVLDPEGESGHPASNLAPRPTELDGKVLWFVDGHGDSEGGKLVMNKIFKAWKARLEEEYSFADIHWVRTENTTTPFRHGKETFEKIVQEADVVINGVAL